MKTLNHEVTMKSKLLTFVGAAIIAAFSLSCGTTSVYDGPVGDHPVVSVTTLRHVDSVTNPMNPTWTRISTLHVSNPSPTRAMKVVVDCEIQHQAGFSGVPPEGGTRDHLTVGSRTTQDVLLAPSDGDCTVMEE